MQFIDFKEKLREFTVFSLNEIRKIDPDFDLRRLNEWTDKKYIRKVRRGYYIFSDLQINEQNLFIIANAIYQPSYISLEMVFSLHNLIPEGVYQITSVTSQKTNIFKTDIGVFTYKHLKSELMFGYELMEYNNRNYLVAEMGKAVLDYFYLNPHIKDKKDFDGLRFNISEFKAKVDMGKFKKYIETFNNKALSVRIKRFITYINND
jgi:predicted transcriptional regulator of viral defense system